MLGWLDMQKLPCYLNTQNENNIGLYEHYGFQVIEQVGFTGFRYRSYSHAPEPAIGR